MADREGGQWNVGIKSGSVFLERVSEDGERLIEDTLDGQEARDLSRLLRKYADKLDDSDLSEQDRSDKDSDESKDDDSEDDEDDDDSGGDDDDEDDGDDEDDEDDEDDDESGRESD
jgi:hypothetical protein